MKIRILGSGTSSGVPRIGNDWGMCDPNEPRNRRTRASALVEHAGTRLLIDTGPDMREQLLAAGVGSVDAVIWTHDHADHVHGIDDLRQLFHNLGRPVRALARPAMIERMLDRFAYVFNGRAGYPPTVIVEPLPDRIEIGGITVMTVDQPHGTIVSAGLRFEASGGAIGYATDFHELTPAMRRHYQALDIWVVDALRRAPHPTHPTLDAVLGWVSDIGPGRTTLIHMDNSMDYQPLRGALPAGVEPGYDGLELAC